MKTAIERLQFVTRFAHMNLDSLRPGDWLNLRDDLGAFLAGAWHGLDMGKDCLPLAGGDVHVHPVDPFMEDLSEEAFHRLQEETHVILNDMVLGPREGKVGQFKQIPIQVKLSAPSLDGLLSRPGQHALIAEGATRDVFLLLVFMLLKQGGTEQIIRCPECRTIFYRVGKQQYCCRTCSNRASVRNWRHRQEATPTALPAGMSSVSLST